MQQDGNPAETERFLSDAGQNHQYMPQQVNTAMVQGGMLQSPINTYPIGSNLGSDNAFTSQLPPYSHSTVSRMSSSFPRQPSLPMGTPPPSQLSYQTSSVGPVPNQAWPNQQSAMSNMYIQQSPSRALPPTSPQRRLVTMQAMPQNVAPPSPNSPRKSLVGMMSPLRPLNQATNMPPPSPNLTPNMIQGPLSPLSVYMNQSPHRSNQMPPSSPGLQQSMYSPRHPCSTVPTSPYGSMPFPSAYNVQRSPIPEYPQRSPNIPASPRYINPTHSPLSPMIQGQHIHTSPQPAHHSVVNPAGVSYKAARQLDLASSPQKTRTAPAERIPVPVRQQYPQPVEAAVTNMWDDAFQSSVVPSLPVLSSDTLDLLSTLTVSTVSTQDHVHPQNPVVPESHTEKSPLLQQHLLMPSPPIILQKHPLGTQQKTAGASETPRQVKPEIRISEKSRRPQRDPSKGETPPSRSNLMHDVHKSLNKEEKYIRANDGSSKPVTSTCTNTKTESSIVNFSLTTSVSDNLSEKVKSSSPTESTDKSAKDKTAVSESVTKPEMSVQNKEPFVTMVTPSPTSAFITTSATSVQSLQMSVVTTTTVCSTAAADVATTVTSTIAHALPSVKCLKTPVVPPEVAEKRLRICDRHRAKLKEDSDSYKEKLTELFFLQNGGIYMDFIQFKKRPSTKLLEFLNKMMPDGQYRSRARKEPKEYLSSNGEPMSPASDISTSSKSSRKVSSDDGKKTRFKKSPLQNDREVPKEPKSLTQADEIPKSVLRPTSNEKVDGVSLSHVSEAVKVVIPPPPSQNHLSLPKGPMSPLRLKRLQRQSAPLDESIGSQEEILERAKQEAVIQRKVVELRKQGLWTQRRLPKVQEPPRNKAHWDYLLEEMRWLAADFAQERKWKRAAARKLVRTVFAYHKEQHDKVKRAEREEQNRLRRIASTMAREIRIFWGNIEKVVEYKQRSLLDEKRQKALDLHLSYIVDQTEKYSDWLTQGLNKQTPGSSPTRSLNSSKPGSDDDFLPQGESSDDEETIAVAEEELEKSENTEDEISLLQQESQLPFDELLSSLPPEVIENIGKPIEDAGAPEETDGKEERPGTSDKGETKSEDETKKKESDIEAVDSDDDSKPTPISLRRSARKRKADVPADSAEKGPESPKKKKVEPEADEEFDADLESDSGQDDEATVEEEEKQQEVDHEKEIKDLEAEGEMPIEELMKKYAAAFSEDADMDDAGSTASEEDSQDEGEKSDNEESETEAEDSEDEDKENEQEEEIGMDYLLKADFTKEDATPIIVPATEQEKPEVGGSPNKEITDVAAEAASLQPTGFTLATTQVVTPIPVLLKHTLREYQHIGLDWLVTMYDKRLNGILADEMGLGKTIQTIALLAHLACEKGVWGPHLIVVPTSVMLNWEMEFKKWCPGFKILTYYGSQKERKAKRTGWTKSNAFHVCITSYKLVLQDNVSFRRKKWKYLVLDEAQNIKNFKSQRWQTLLNFNSQRRLLLTGTPLQNNLMELWSLMHFLMPHVFQSHKEFKEWFSNPLTGMIEGSQEYNEKLVRRLHKVLRPFLLRRVKKDVEKQMPNKYEHVVRCHLSKRQRFLYEDFMSRTATKDTLATGHFMSVINILMQLRKVCNHPNLFEPRPIVSPFISNQIDFYTASLITRALEKHAFENLNLQDYNLHLLSLCNIHQYNAARARELQTPKKLIEEIEEIPTEAERSKVTRSQAVREQLAQLLREREKRRAKNSATLTLSQPLLIPQSNTQQMNSLPVLTIPMTSGTGATGGNLLTSRVITIPTAKSDGTDTAGGRVTTTQPFTLQYQTAQGTRVTIPSKQIRQFPGGVVQIVTSGITPRTTGTSGMTVTPTSSQQNATAQLVMPGGGTLNVKNGTATVEAQTKKDLIQDVTPLVNRSQATSEEPEKTSSPETYADALQLLRAKERKERLARMAAINQRRCESTPNWLPLDTIQFLKNICCHPLTNSSRKQTTVESTVMKELVKTTDVLLNELRPITDRFVFNIPRVESKAIDFHVSHPAPALRNHDIAVNEKLQKALNHALTPYHPIQQSMRVLFPEARLIQYDCGKLQVLDILLRRFWTEKHRCLIFTQMTKVLDILEAFLSYHGYRYLRLDGSTRVEQRMSLMERFNNDPRIFCFILSTRSGGVGVNLTGADTVIFYDSDWNPTMDAQAQDRCHRIGQTRDVHIYRLISERTVEENILKKANQKRLLGDLAIEGGSFTTAFFKEQAIKDLFNEPTGLEDLPSAEIKEEDGTSETPAPPLSRPITARQKAIAAAKEAEAKGEEKSDELKTSQVSGESEGEVAKTKEEKEPKSWEDALQETEDREDVAAAKLAKEEQDADMEEFKENAEGEEETEEYSRVHEEMKSLYEELTPVERYALRYLEETTEEVNKEELQLAEEQVHQSKKDWEITHLMALKEEEERRLEEEEDEIFYTRDDAENQVYIDDVTGETMPVWFPPTPPQDDNDVYIDPITCLLYRPTPMTEDQLPSVHVKRERKRTKAETESPGGISGPRRKIARAEFHAPRSLFNRPQSHLKKRDLKSHKFRPQMKKPPGITHPKPGATPVPASGTADKENVTSSSGEQVAPLASAMAAGATATEPVTESVVTKSPDWLINEDWKLLQAVQQVLEMPLSLAVLMPAHTPNWDLVADIVNSVSCVYRSPKMCKQRFENVLAPREEGRASREISLKKKLKGTKALSKVTKPQKTTSLHAVDNNFQHSGLFSNRFDTIKETCSKRTTPLKSSSSGQFQRNPKHTSILMDNGIVYDKPLTPIQVASLRAERIAREKQAVELAKQQQLVQTQTIPQHQTNIPQISSAQMTKTAGNQLTAIPLSGGASNIIVNSNTLSALTKKMSQQQTMTMTQFSVATPKTTKTTLSNTALQQTLLRSNSGQTQQQLQQQPQIQIQQANQVGTVVTVGLLHRLSSSSSTASITTSVSNSNTITLSSLTRPSSITVPAGAFITNQQQIQKQLTQQLSKQQQQQQQQQRLQQQTQIQLQKQQQQKKIPRLQIPPEAIKQLRQQQRQQQQQQLEASVVTVAKVSGKQRKTTPLTQQELEQLLKNPTMRRTMQKGQTAQVQIAPVQAQVQAQQVQAAAAQQAAQHIVTSKPLPITVPVSSLVSVAAVNLGGMNMSIASTNAGTSGQAKPLVVTGQQVPVNVQQQILQRQLLKQRMVQQQQQQTRTTGPVLASKVGGKQTVYAMMAPIVSQNKRRLSIAASTGATVGSQQQQVSGQQPVQLTMTKLLQSQAVAGQSNTHIKQALAQQGVQALNQQSRSPQVGTQQVAQHQQVATATIVPASSMTAQQQRLVTTQRQMRQIHQLVSNQQPTQMILTPASSVGVSSSQQFLQRQNQNVVASISIPAVSSTSQGQQQQVTLTAPNQQSGQLSQQLQNLLTSQRSQSTTPSTPRTSTQQHQVVLSQVTPQQSLSIAPQTPITMLSTPTTPTTMTLAPSLVPLPASAVPDVVGGMPSSMPVGTNGTQQSQAPPTSVQYVTRSHPQ